MGTKSGAFLARKPRGAARNGQALVEFALILPILLILVLGLIDFARAWSAQHAIADAAREGARMLVVDNNVPPDDARTAIENRLRTARLDAGRADIDFEPASGFPATPNGPITVTIGYPYDFWMLGPIIGWTTGERQISLVSTITMRSER
jgi:Flp pilus assembly protein TadG